MRNLIAAGLAALAAACSVGPDGGQGPAAAPPAEGYTLEIVADEAAARAVYIVSHSDGRAVAARAERGASALADVAEAQAMAAASFGVMGETETPVALRFPGFQMSVAGKDGGAGGERVRIAINAGGREVLVDAQDPDAGSDAGRGTVRIVGVDEAEVREFIAEAEHLSDETRAQMLAALNLSAQ